MEATEKENGSAKDVTPIPNNNTDIKTNKNNMPPTIEEVKEYCKSRKNGIDAEAFIDYYAQQGWKLANGNKMKDWQAAVRTWEKREKKKQEPKPLAYEKYDPGPPIDSVPMPDDIRKSVNKLMQNMEV